ncbi:MAG: hypothetical protein NXH75_18010 [Halobacteriovoraceae bacterium]|nr:hypothetical protein [Halobacteriovoraceae bacterium]
MLKTWGIHLFKSQVGPGLHQAFYFVERPFGNLCLFTPPHPLFENPQKATEHLEFMESKGGVAFQIPVSLHRASFSQKKIFSRFGAPFLVKENSELLESWVQEDYLFRYGIYGEDFFDHRVEFARIMEQEIILIRKEMNREYQDFVFFPTPFIYDRGQIRIGLSGPAVTEMELVGATYTKTLNNPVFLFQFFRGSNWCDGGDMLS